MQGPSGALVLLACYKLTPCTPYKPTRTPSHSLAPSPSHPLRSYLVAKKKMATSAETLCR